MEGVETENPARMSEPGCELNIGRISVLILRYGSFVNTPHSITAMYCRFSTYILKAENSWIHEITAISSSEICCSFMGSAGGGGQA